MTKHKQTRREKFLLEMDAVVAWGRLLSVIDPHYPKAVGTTAKTSDMSQFANLLHGDETRVSADRGYVYA